MTDNTEPQGGATMTSPPRLIQLGTWTRDLPLMMQGSVNQTTALRFASELIEAARIAGVHSNVFTIGQWRARYPEAHEKEATQ
jgi:hypothetical protein